MTAKIPNCTLLGAWEAEDFCSFWEILGTPKSAWGGNDSLIPDVMERGYDENSPNN